MRWLLWAVWLLAAPAIAAPPAKRVDVIVTRDADGGWTADYRFRERAGAWMFPRSNPDLDGKPWRQRSWTVETPGVTLERLGRYDALVAKGGVPTRVRVRFAPLAEPLRADYQPAVRFTDGSVALYLDHFTVAPQPSAAAVAQLGFDLSNLADRPVAMELRAPGQRILARGTVARGVARLRPGQADAYVYVGDLPPVETPALVGVIDPGMPGWVRGELDALLPRLLAYYTQRLGKPAGARPTALVAWGGAARGGVSLSGNVLDGMVVMDLSGKQLVEQSQPVLDRVRMHFAHEAAHFWFAHTIRYESPADAWITEGSADLLAIRALGVLTPGYNMRVALQREVDQCLKLNGAKPLGGASERGDTRANYACGALLMLVAEGAERRRDPSADAATFAKRLLDANRADGVVTRADWLAAFSQASGDPAATARIAAFIERGVPDHVTFIAQLLDAAGVGYTRAGDAIRLT